MHNWKKLRKIRFHHFKRQIFSHFHLIISFLKVDLKEKKTNDSLIDESISWHAEIMRSTRMAIIYVSKITSIVIKICIHRMQLKCNYTDTELEMQHWQSNLRESIHVSAVFRPYRNNSIKNYHEYAHLWPMNSNSYSGIYAIRGYSRIFHDWKFKSFTLNKNNGLPKKKTIGVSNICMLKTNRWLSVRH